jgi:hypothetical protein
MAEPSRHDEPLLNPDVRHEPSDASAVWVLAFAGVLTLLAAIVLVLLFWLFRPLLRTGERGELPPEPRLEGLVSDAAPTEPLKAPRGAPPKYGWVDRKTGIVRIPVEDAIEILARKAAEGTGRGGPGLLQRQPGRPSSSNSGRTLPGGQTFLSAPGGQP